MESDRDDLRQSLRELDRAEAAPYVDYPPTPRWYPPAGGLWVAALVGAVALSREHALVGVLAILALVAVESAFVGWYSHRHGALPSLRTPPREFRPLFLRYLVGVTVVAVVVIGGYALLGPLAAAVLALVLVTAGLAVYERAYAATARATRARLA